MIPGSANPLLLASAAPVAAYNIERSLRFNSADSAYLSRTPASAGNRKTWTWAAWVKRSATGGLQVLFDCRPTLSDTTVFTISFLSDVLAIGQYSFYALQTTSVYRDLSAWYHIVFALDTTQATASNRMKLYVNGSQVTAFSTTNYPAQNSDLGINQAGAHSIGTAGGSYFFSGYLADIHFIDGQALTPTSFGEFDVNNVWQPKAYTGTFTGNSFWLKFADNSAATATTLGKDSSGLGNNWTPNNLSVTAGAGNDSLVDSPTNYGTDTGAGGEVRGNYCTLNPLQSSAALSDGNLACSNTLTSWQANVSTIFQSSGKWYAEITVTNSGGGGIHIGIVGPNYSVATGNYIGNTATSYAYRFDGLKYNNNTAASYGAGYTTSDVIGVAMDLDAGTLVFYKNGVSQGTAYSGMTGEKAFAVSVNNNGSAASVVLNFGQRPFAYPVSGFKALCTANLPTPTIANGATAMDVVLYTGTGATLTPTSTLGFSPDLVWIKSRSAATDNTLYDSVRGAQARLESNTTDAEVTSDNGLTAFNSNGFTLGTLAQVNTNAATYAGWAWDAGSSTVTNTSGSISSQVRANTNAGFSIVTYTGTGANASVGHGLGSPPAFIIIKQRNGAIVWVVYHKDVGTNAYLSLDTTLASTSNSNYWGASAPSSTVFNLSTYGGNNGSANTYVAYCFAPVAGYSAFGSYTGNGGTDGPFVFLGFRPAVVIVKMSSSTGNWTILDDKREGYNVDNDPLYPNLLDAEGATDLIDITSNGFKVRTTDATFNTNAGTYVYAAWASSPFAYARAR